MNYENCQLPCLPNMSTGLAEIGPQPLIQRFKRTLAVPWNYQVKPRLRKLYRYSQHRKSVPVPQTSTNIATLKSGDWVRVRSLEEIEATLNPFKELKGCAFLSYMVEYCGTTQKVLQVVQRFLDERDYKVKKTNGVILLEGVICRGTPAFGQCDRCCFLFWREEWLEKIPQPEFE